MASKTVLLVNPSRMRPPIGPVGLEYVAASLRGEGYEPRLCDLTFAEDWRETLSDALEGADLLSVAFSVRNIDDCYFASQDFVLETTREMIEHARTLTDAPVVLGGVGFCIAPREVLAYSGADYGVVGDGELVLPDLMDCLASGGDVGDVPGAVYRDDGGDIAVNPHELSNPHHAAAPSRRFIDNRRYFAEGGQAGVETKRGCGQNCIYCVEPASKGNCVRARSPESVADEFEDLLDQGIDVIHLCDSEFNLPPEHAHAVCEALRSRGLGSQTRWYAYASPQGFDEDLARTMAEAGCVGIDFGVDHTDESLLRRLGRVYGPDAIRTTARACRAANIAFMFDMLFGGPGETRDTLAGAIEFMRDVQPDKVGLSCGIRLYRCTPLARMAAKQGTLESNPNVFGTTVDNDSLLRPVYYVEAGLGEDIHRIVTELVGGDPLFLHADPHEVEGNYNYNDNSVLSNAIRDGARGAYWDILRKQGDNAR